MWRTCNEACCCCGDYQGTQAMLRELLIQLEDLCC